MALSPGTRLDAYEILSLIGSGGMGEVYRARDPRLGRDVAVKVLPASFSSDPERLRRFELEARAAAALNHPNILAVYDIGIYEQAPYIVSELLEGETLREQLQTGPLPQRRVVEYAAQMAHGLAAAHEKRIVHRDLKPENVLVVSGRRIKILDFGLAKLAQAESTQSGQSLLPTVSPATIAGRLLGTVGYMAPEQISGQASDSRSDLFAFGVILYEMLYGRRAFQRATDVETMAAILREEPPNAARRSDLPPALERIMRRCLEKNPIERFQSASDLAFALDGSSDTASRNGTATAGSFVATPWRWSALVLVLALAIGVAVDWWTRVRHMAAVQPTVLFSQLTDFPGNEWAPSLSSDGGTVVYAADSSSNSDIYSLRVGGRNPINLTSDSADADLTPVLSPAGDRIAFRSERAGGGIFVMGATGESVRRVTDFGYSPSWSPDGRQLVVSTVSIDGPFLAPFLRVGTGDLAIVTVATGEHRRLNVSRDAVQPTWSPHGQRIAFWSVERLTGQRDIWTIAADGSAVPLPVTNDSALDWNPVWSPDGRFLYFASDRGGVMDLWRMPIDEGTGRPSGAAEPLNVPTSFPNGFSLAKDGRLVFSASDRRSRLLRLEFDPQREALLSTQVTVFQSPRMFRMLDWSPDGAALALGDYGSSDNLYFIRADGTGFRQLTDDRFRNRGPRWFPDGSRLLFYSNRGGSYQVWSIKPDGSGLQQLTHSDAGIVFPTLSPAGDRIAYVPSLSTAWSIAELKSPNQITVIQPPTMALAISPYSWSPDGSRIALVESPPRASDPKIVVYELASQKYTQLDPTGGWPSWLPDSRRLLFTTRRGVSLVDTQTGRAHEIFSLPTELSVPDGAFAVSADGRWMALLGLEEQGDFWMLTPR